MTNPDLSFQQSELSELKQQLDKRGLGKVSQDIGKAVKRVLIIGAVAGLILLSRKRMDEMEAERNATMRATDLMNLRPTASLQVDQPTTDNEDWNQFIKDGNEQADKDKESGSDTQTDEDEKGVDKKNNVPQQSQQQVKQSPREKFDKANKAAKKRLKKIRDAKKAKKAKKKLNQARKNLNKADDIGDTARSARRFKRTAKTVKDLKRAKKVVKVVKTVKTVKSVALLANPIFWWVLLILLILWVLIIIVFSIFGGIVNKVEDEAGGSFVSSMNCNREYDKKLVEDVLFWTENPSGDGLVPRLGVTEALKKDLQWQGEECGEDMTHKLDKRVLETLRYLVNDIDNDNGIPALAWPHISIGMLADGPHQTLRPLSEKEKEENEFDSDKAVAAFSAYRMGQAIGITAIGVTSIELTQAMGLLNPRPVAVDWQRVVELGTLYPAYEQMQLDVSELYELQNKLVFSYESAKEILEEVGPGENKISLDVAKSLYDEPKELIGNLIRNLSRVSSIDNSSMSEITLRYMGKARLNFSNALADIEVFLAGLGPEVDFSEALALWVEGIENPDAIGVAEEDMQIYQKVREGIRFTFRAMQVANMDGWKGSVGENLYLWQAYESRSNIRQLVIDLLQMPIKLKGGVYGLGYGPLVRQLIVFSPEDDLDNGLPDIEVYPEGAVAVSDGGVAFELRAISENYRPRVDIWDNHFSDLRIDNGVLFKACTDFVYDLEKLDKEGELNDTATLGAFRADENMNKLCEVLYGRSEYELEETEMSGKVTYQKFVHIGF